MHPVGDATRQSAPLDEAAALPDDLWEAWDRFFAALRQARGRAAQRQEGELTLSQYHLLLAVDEQPEAGISRLAELAGVAPPTATRMIDGLERAGVVVREPSDGDRRAVCVRFSDDGRAVFERKRRVIAGKRRALAESLSETEREQAAHLLRRLAEGIEAL